MLKKILHLLLFIALSKFSFATHNRAGELTYTQISALQYEFILTTFTDISNPKNADRETATLNFGDGSSATANRYEKLTIAPFIQRNRYKFNHSFPGYSTYTISFQDPNRNNNVQNMINSLNTPFYVESQLVINPFIGFNNSPTLLLEPIDFGAENKLFVHNPNAFDIDGDSLSFKLIACKQDVGVEVYGFQLPSLQNGFTDTSFSIDASSGQIIWNTPQITNGLESALYNIAIMVEEWRYVSNAKKFIRIGFIVRDMQIEIVKSDNKPPVIKPLKDTCIIAGSLFTQLITANDKDNHAVTLTATGGPFKLGPPDTVSFPQPVTGNTNVSQTFRWQTSCNGVRKQPYQIVIKAIDNGSPKLVDLEDWQIKIISPAPQNLTCNAIGSTIILNWDKLNCGQAVGYKIYRRSGAYPFTPTACQTGVPIGVGYELIKKVENINTITFIDDNDGQGLSTGNNYCYRIVAYFPDDAESIASNESCEILTRDLPALTHVDILTSNASTGTDSVKWVKPSQLDTIQYPGPYEYQLLKSIDDITYTTVKTVTTTFLGNLNDSVYLDINSNTLENQLFYKLAFYANNNLVGTSKKASSIFLNAVGRDNRVELNWNVTVPWTNAKFTVYRFNNSSAQYDSIGFSTSNNYIDRGLVNSQNYCYFVKAIGSYTAGGFPEPLINNSQIRCATPIDIEKPCPPVLTVSPSCGLYRNILTWTNPNDSCSDDVVKYRIYKSMFEGSEFSVLTSDIAPATTLTYTDANLFESIAGCYFITAIDSFDNESDRSNLICIDNCPAIVLPNVFTPNEDGFNDLFTPIKDSTDFVSKFTVHIYDRWGTEVYETNDPKINWNGKTQDNNKDLPAGVYFYSVEFSEIRVKGYKQKNLSGFVHLVR